MKQTCQDAAREALAEKTAAKSRAGGIAVRPLVLSAFMGAVSAVLMAMEFPVPLAPGFVKMDFSDLPVILGGFIMGPLAGMRIIAVKIGLSFLLKGTVTMGVGELANMIGSVSYMLPAVLLYRRWHTRLRGRLGSALQPVPDLSGLCPAVRHEHGQHRGHGKGHLPVGDGPVFHDAVLHAALQPV